jgi:CheY-like chemotaxis protein
MRRLVLIVEDENLTHAIAVATIITEGFAVLGAGSAEDALDELAEKRVPDIVALITDVHLSGHLDGFTLAHRARQMQPAIALLISSGRPYPDAAQRLPPRAEFLSKPYAPADLLGAFRRAIEAVGNSTAG